MNRLELCQRVRQECSISGSGPASTIAQVGQMKSIVDWTDDAWNDIQTTHQDWDWMRASTSFVTTAGLATYPLGTGAGTCGVTAATFGKWARNTFRSYLTSVGTNNEIPLWFKKYDHWRDVYMIGALRSVQTRPDIVSIAPDRSICLGPPPIAGYTITGDYFTAPLAMTADADIPSLPVHFHMAIVWKAVEAYGYSESASEVISRGQTEFGKLMKRMTADRLPEVGFSGTLA